MCGSSRLRVVCCHLRPRVLHGPMPLRKARQRARIARPRHVQRRGDRIPSADFGAELAERRGDGVGIGARCAHAERERRRFLRGRPRTRHRYHGAHTRVGAGRIAGSFCSSCVEWGGAAEPASRAPTLSRPRPKVATIASRREARRAGWSAWRGRRGGAGRPPAQRACPPPGQYRNGQQVAIMRPSGGSCAPAVLTGCAARH